MALERGGRKRGGNDTLNPDITRHQKGTRVLH